MDQEQLEALLGRDLTANEVTNLSTYLDIASAKLESLICTSFFGDEGSGDEAETRMFESRKGYSTVFTDIFHEVVSVTIDGETRTDYEVRQGDNLNGSWYNSLVFDDRFRSGEVVTIEAHWGFETVPSDLQLLWARLFGSIDSEQGNNSNVTEQRIEDAWVKFDSNTLVDHLVSDNRLTIAKYSICGVGMVRHGRVGNRGHWHGHF